MSKPMADADLDEIERYAEVIHKAWHGFADDCPPDEDSIAAAVAVRSLVAAEVVVARADDAERIRAVCRMLLNSGDITPMGVRLIEQVSERSGVVL